MVLHKPLFFLLFWHLFWLFGKPVLPVISRQKTTDFAAEYFSALLVGSTDSPRSKISTWSNARQVAGARIAGWKVLLYRESPPFAYPLPNTRNRQTSVLEQALWLNEAGRRAWPSISGGFTAAGCTSVLLKQLRHCSLEGGLACKAAPGARVSSLGGSLGSEAASATLQLY